MCLCTYVCCLQCVIGVVILHKEWVGSTMSPSLLYLFTVQLFIKLYGTYTCLLADTSEYWVQIVPGILVTLLLLLRILDFWKLSCLDISDCVYTKGKIWSITLNRNYRQLWGTMPVSWKLNLVPLQEQPGTWLLTYCSVLNRIYFHHIIIYYIHLNIWT